MLVIFAGRKSHFIQEDWLGNKTFAQEQTRTHVGFILVLVLGKKQTA